jgi:hypothetical protein
MRCTSSLGRKWGGPRLGVWLVCGLCAAAIAAPRSQESADSGTHAQEIWMGVYINGVKVGHSRTAEEVVIRQGHEATRITSESQIRVSRLGSDPIELVTIQESWQDMQARPLEIRLVTKMSATETVISAVVNTDKVVFSLGDKTAKELPVHEPFYLDIPVERILAEDGLREGASYAFKILDPVAYALSDCRFLIRGEEDVLILGEKKRLWHVTTELDSLIPMVVEEWIDDTGLVHKAVTHAGFMSTTALLMSQEKALEQSPQTFDIAFSTLIVSNRVIPQPQSVQRLRFRLSGLPVPKLRDLPWDNDRQRLLEIGDDFVVGETASRIFLEKDAPSLPLATDEHSESLASTVFCQVDDPDIRKTARDIVGGERNAWRAAKKIAEWIDGELTPNYDVGFASAREILENREGDCSEHTVLFVALCRAVGIPARALVGIMYGDGIFAYHMWPEVFVGRWVALDPKWLARDPETGEFYTDATHIKFGHSDLDSSLYQEMITSISEIIGKLKLEVLEFDSP